MLGLPGGRYTTSVTAGPLIVFVDNDAVGDMLPVGWSPSPE
jgi:hypothetical protein